MNSYPLTGSPPVSILGLSLVCLRSRLPFRNCAAPRSELRSQRFRPWSTRAYHTFIPFSCFHVTVTLCVMYASSCVSSFSVYLFTFATESKTPASTTHVHYPRRLLNRLCDSIGVLFHFHAACRLQPIHQKLTS